ncbi:MAG TPA: hypothetical protein VKA21_16020 [Candidatus Binatia bacterium]|nr:hypothetical protein [Candidatus Binatia bacterium]
MARSLPVLLTLVVAAACGPPARPRHPELMERTLFLCCNAVFNQNRAATDANYVYGDGGVLRAGTPVRIVDTDDEGVVLFVPEGGSARYRLAFQYGRANVSAAEYFASIFLPDDPRTVLADAPAATTAAARDGRLVRGMTPAQAIVARGYPPRHMTPSLEGEEWIYYESPGVVDRVRFAGGRIESIERGPAPVRR